MKIKKILIGIGGTLLLLIIWGCIEPYTIRVEEEKAIIPNLPKEWAGEKIAVISDFQVGLWMDNDGVLSKMVDEILEINPKIVLILGDFVYHSTDNHKNEMENVINYLKPLTENGLKVYAVLGNHDYGLGTKEATKNMETANRVKTMLKQIDIHILNNESIALSLHNGEVEVSEDTKNSMYIIGIGSNWAKDDNIEMALSTFPEEAPRFVMMHNPATYPSFPLNSAPIAVGGHTHGGQFRIPFSPSYTYLDLTSEEPARVDGWIKNESDENSNRLYVNRGIGMSIVPMRLNCPPEITVFTLQSK